VKTIGSYPRLRVDTADVAAAGHAGGVLLTETVRAAGLDWALSAALGPWRKPLAVHDPGKVVLDLAMMLALGGDALSDLATVRAEPGVYGPVASDPTVSRMITALAGDAERVLAAIGSARQHARTRVWALAGEHAPDAGSSPDAPLVIDLDATLITAHSEKEDAAPTFKRGFGFHPLCAFVECRVEHRRRPHRCRESSPRSAARWEVPAGEGCADPCRRCRRDERVRDLAHEAAVVVLGRIYAPVPHPRPLRAPHRAPGVGTRARRRRRGP